jgi:hypothetical protein
MDEDYIKEALYVEDYINKTWPGRFRVVVRRPHGVPLRELFPEPRNTGLRHIWRHGSVDVVVYNGDKLIAGFEPGGSQHFQDEIQMKNDRRKWKLFDVNGVKCFRYANGLLEKLSNRQRRKLVGRYLFGIKE